MNEAFFLADVLLHPAVESHTNAPPTSPAEGACWLVGTSPSGVWTGHAGALATFNAGEWTFVPPRNGMTLMVVGTGQMMRYRNGWQAATPVSAPTGGTVIDIEARAAIADIRAALVATGILPQP